MLRNILDYGVFLIDSYALAALLVDIIGIIIISRNGTVVHPESTSKAS